MQTLITFQTIINGQSSQQSAQVGCVLANFGLMVHPHSGPRHMLPRCCNLNFEINTMNRNYSHGHNHTHDSEHDVQVSKNPNTKVDCTGVAKATAT